MARRGMQARQDSSRAGQAAVDHHASSLPDPCDCAMSVSARSRGCRRLGRCRTGICRRSATACRAGARKDGASLREIALPDRVAVPGGALPLVRRVEQHRLSAPAHADHLHPALVRQAVLVAPVAFIQHHFDVGDRAAQFHPFGAVLRDAQDLRVWRPAWRRRRCKYDGSRGPRPQCRPACFRWPIK